MNKPFLNKLDAVPEMVMLEYAITDNDGIESGRDYIEVYPSTSDEDLVKQIKEQHEEYLRLGLEDGKLWSMLSWANNVVIGKTFSYEQYEAELKKHRPGAHRVDKLEGRTFPIGDLTPDIDRDDYDHGL